MTIKTQQDGRDFAAEVLIEWANNGGEAANAKILSLGRVELQIAYSALLVKYAEIFKASNELLDVLEGMEEVPDQVREALGRFDDGG